MNTVLFRKSATRMRCWSIKVEGPLIITATGDVGGTMTCHERWAEGKNTGRSNATTDEAQAKREAAALVAARYKEGWCVSIEEAEKSTVNEANVMLASDAKKNPALCVYPCDAQRKLNGMRNDASLGESRVVCMSRRKNEITTLPREITDELFMLLTTYNRMGNKPILRTDGELYAHGFKLQQIVSMVKNEKAPHREHLNYHIYDIINDDVWEERNATLTALRELVDMLGLTRIVIEHSERLTCKADQQRALANAKAGGFEGIMLRTLNDVYYHSRTESDRPSCLVKDKGSMDSEEFEVVSYEVDVRGGAIPVCKVGAHTFKAPLEGTSEWREYVHRNFAKFRGKMLTVRFYGVSVDGIPQNPVGEAFRDYE